MNRLFTLIAHQDWIRFGIRDRILRKYCNPDTVGSTEFETDFFGLKYKGNLNSFLDWSVFFYGAYEKEYLFFLKNLVKDTTDPVFIDVGANVGHHSLFMSQFCSQVHSFEPNPEVRKKIEEKILINSLNNISVHNVGLGVKNEDLPFYSPKGANKGTGSFIADHSLNNELGTTLRVANGDEYISNLLLSKIDLIKIDVEGFEKNVLIGLKDTIEKYRPTIVIEYSATTMKSFSGLEEFMSLFPARYKVKRVLCNNARYIMFNSPKCRLVNFDFKIPGGDLLISPG